MSAPGLNGPAHYASWPRLHGPHAHHARLHHVHHAQPTTHASTVFPAHRCRTCYSMLSAPMAILIVSPTQSTMSRNSHPHSEHPSLDPGGALEPPVCSGGFALL